MIQKDKEITIKYVSGVEGNSIYLNDTRIAGPKPWGRRTYNMGKENNDKRYRISNWISF